MAELQVTIDGRGAQRGERDVVRSLSNIRKETARGEKGFRNMNREMSQTAKTSQLLRRALAGIGVGLAVRQFIQLSDGFTEVENKVRIATEATGGFNKTLDELFDIANRTRAPIESIAQLYQRASLAANELGVSQNELLEFTESIGQALAIQGGSAASSSGALLQLSQALGSGIVRAEEFNSILEGAFPIALAAAEGLDAAGGSVAKLRSLVIEGKVSSTEFFEAIQSQAPRLAELFSNANITIAQSFTVLRNRLVEFTGNFNKATGLATGFATAIKFLADNLDNLARAIGVVIAALGPLGLLKSLQLAGGAVGGLLQLLARANPFVLIVSGISAAIGALNFFGDRVNAGIDEVTTLRDVAIAVFNLLKKAFFDAADAITRFFEPAIRFIQERLGDIPLTLGDVLTGFRRFANASIGIFVGIGEVVAFGFGQIRTSLEDFLGEDLIFFFTQSGRAIIDFWADVFGKVVGIVQKALGFIGIESKSLADGLGAAFDFVLPDSVADGFRGFGEEAGDIFVNALQRDYIGEIGAFLLPAIEAVSAEAARVAQQRLQDEADRLLIDTQTAKPQTDRPFERTKELQTLIDGLRTPVEKLRDDLASINEFRALEGIATDAAALESLVRADEAAVREFAEAVGGVDPSPFAEVENAIRLIEDQLMGVNNQVESRILEQALDNMNDELVDLKLNALGLSDLETIMQNAIPPAERYRQVVEKLNILLADNPEALAAAIQEAKEKILGLENVFEKFAESAAESLQNTLADFLFDPFEDGVKGMIRSFAESIRRMAAEVLANQILQSFFNNFAGGSGPLGQFANLALGALGGAQFGAQANAGVPMTVGESGGKPELFIPQTSGRVMTSQQASQAMSPNVTVQPAPVIIVDDPKKAIAAMHSREGQDATVTAIRGNSEAVKRDLGVA